MGYSDISDQAVFNLGAATALVFLAAVLVFVLWIGPAYWWPTLEPATAEPAAAEENLRLPNPSIRVAQPATSALRGGTGESLPGEAEALRFLSDRARTLRNGAVVLLANGGSGAVARGLDDFLLSIARPDIGILALEPDTKRAAALREASGVAVAETDVSARGTRLDVVTDRVDLLYLTEPGSAAMEAARGMLLASKGAVVLAPAATDTGAEDLGFVQEDENAGVRSLRGPRPTSML